HQGHRGRAPAHRSQSRDRRGLSGVKINGPVGGPMPERSILRRLLGLPARTTAPKEAARDAQKVIDLCQALMSERGEVSGARLATETLDAYKTLDDTSLPPFFDLLASVYAPDPDAVSKAADDYRESPTPANLLRLQQAVDSPRQELFRRLNMAPGGTAVLVEMRRRLLRDLRDTPQWIGIDADLAHLFRSWFNRGFLLLERIDWRTSAQVLEKLIKYEAVHEIQGWRDLRRRTQADRRCYAFFHPALPEEPLIFIEVALTKGISDKVQPLLDPEAPVFDAREADSAMFYSITNCQEGLRGVSFGNLLIKQVAEDLGREFPKLKTFSTLSPIPGFRAWLTAEAGKKDGEPRREHLADLLTMLDLPDWMQDKDIGARLQRELTRLCAYYLLHAKSRSEPLDSVARFHLGNGARLERLKWLGDTSPTGIRRSAGLMVNYVYDLGDLERNHEAYAKDQRIIAARRFELMARDSLLARAPNKSESKTTS
ncbi:MAG: malonyl-CoA decarboxylase, partial [Burkholderiales bacterium]